MTCFLNWRTYEEILRCGTKGRFDHAFGPDVEQGKNSPGKAFDREGSDQRPSTSVGCPSPLFDNPRPPLPAQDHPVERHGFSTKHDSDRITGQSSYRHDRLTPANEGGDADQRCVVKLSGD